MNKNSDRRDFLKKAGTVFGVGIFAGAFGSVMTSCERDEIVAAPDPETIDLDMSKYPQVSAVGSMAIIEIQRQDGSPLKLFLKRASEDHYIVLEALCRHQTGPLELPGTPGGSLRCIIHGATFNTDNGALINNPTSDTVPDLIKFRVFEFNKQTNILRIEV